MVPVPDTWSRRRTAGAVGVVVVLVVVVAVVGVPFGGGGGDGGPGTGTGTPNVGDVDMPPGIDADGVYDDDALVAAHREALMASGFAFEYVHRVTDRNETGTLGRNIDVTGEVRATANLSTVERRIDRAAPTDERIVTWTNGSASGKRIQANGTTYESYVSSPTWRVTLHYVVMNQIAIARWNLSETREVDGGTRFVLVANDTVRVSDVNDDPRNYTARMVVDAEGRIRHFEVNVTTVALAGQEGNRRAVNRTRHLVYDLTAVGDVSVPPPEWLNNTDGAFVHPRTPLGRPAP